MKILLGLLALAFAGMNHFCSSDNPVKINRFSPYFAQSKSSSFHFFIFRISVSAYEFKLKGIVA